MQIAGGEKDMDTRALGKLQSAGSHLDVLVLGAGEGSYARFANRLGDRCDGCKVTFRGHRKAGLDDVDAQILKGVRHGEFFLRRHAATGRLLAIAQSGVRSEEHTSELQ